MMMHKTNHNATNTTNSDCYKVMIVMTVDIVIMTIMMKIITTIMKNKKR